MQFMSEVGKYGKIPQIKHTASHISFKYWLVLDFAAKILRLKQ